MVLAVVVLPVGMFVMYAGFLIGLNMITFGVGVEACDDPTVWRFPEECRTHLGDRVTGNGIESGKDFIWRGTEAEADICRDELWSMGQTRTAFRYMNPDEWPRCFNNYSDNLDEHGFVGRLKFDEELIEDMKPHEIQLVTPTATPRKLDQVFGVFHGSICCL